MNGMGNTDANVESRKEGGCYGRSEYVSRAKARRSVKQSQNFARGAGACHPGDTKHDITDLVVPPCALAWRATYSMCAVDVERPITKATVDWLASEAGSES